jgi:predicted DNA-binding protein
MVGRPRRQIERKNTAVRLPVVLWDRIDAEADRRDISRALLMEKILSKYLEEWENEDI